MLFSITAGTGLSAEAATVSKVSGLSVTAKGSDYIKLKWKKVNKAGGYQVYYSTNNKKFKIAKTIKKNKTVSAKISGLKAGKKYYFKVRAVKGKSKGKFSKVVNATTTALSGLDIKNAKTSYYYRPKADSSGGCQSILFSFNYVNADGFECRWYYDDTHYNESKVRMI